IFSTDFNGRVSTWNTGARILFGYEESEILGVYGNRLVVDAEARWMADTYEKVRVGERVEGMITLARRRDGSTFHASVFLSPIRSTTGEIVGISTIAHDVSE